jgi:ADP-ribose pyrophosphatase YjhB (NUDIX family)
LNRPVHLVFCPRCATRLDLDPPGRCPACGTEYWANPKPCSGALVERDGAVLLVRRAIEPGFGRWDLPGGFCEAAEHPEDTARRELLEETGLDVELVGLVGMWMDVYGDGDDPEITLNLYYRAVPVSARAEVRLSDEASDAAWFRRDELPSDLAFQHVRDALGTWRALRA